MPANPQQAPQSFPPFGTRLGGSCQLRTQHLCLCLRQGQRRRTLGHHRRRRRLLLGTPLRLGCQPTQLCCMLLQVGLRLAVRQLQALELCCQLRCARLSRPRRLLSQLPLRLLGCANRLERVAFPAGSKEESNRGVEGLYHVLAYPTQRHGHQQAHTLSPLPLRHSLAQALHLLLQPLRTLLCLPVQRQRRRQIAASAGAAIGGGATGICCCC